LEEVDDTADAFFPQPLFGARQQALEDALARLVVDDEVLDGVALGRGVLGVAAHVEVETGAVLEEDVAAPAPGHHPSEQVAGNVDGIYPMGDVHIFGSEEDLPEAQELLLADEVESAFDEDDADGDAGTPRELWVFLVAVIVVAAVLFARSI